MNPTNLTDEGLSELARESCLWRHEQSEVCLNCVRSFTNLKQVRDAAKKETVERAAVLVESSVITRTYGNGQTVVHECSKDPIQLAAAIRQMGGVK